jgi:hypothetical protein
LRSFETSLALAAIFLAFFICTELEVTPANGTPGFHWVFLAVSLRWRINQINFVGSPEFFAGLNPVF